MDGEKVIMLTFFALATLLVMFVVIGAAGVLLGLVLLVTGFWYTLAIQRKARSLSTTRMRRGF